MHYYLGNCQADFLSRSMADRGFDSTYRVLASPLTYPSHSGTIPESLAELEATYGLTEYFYGRTLNHQFQPIGPDDPAPELIVLNLHHESTPLFLHNEEGYIFFMTPQALTDHPRLMTWAQTHCRMFEPNPATYLERYARMLATMRAAHPGVPIVVLSRLSPAPAFGPDPFSYLKGWGSIWQTAEATLNTWANTLDNVHILDMNRVFGGIWRSTDAPIDALCPFLKIKLEEADGQVTGLHARRDIEHIGPMPDRLADKLTDFLHTGAMTYEEDESAPREWNRHWRPRPMDDDSALERLVSGANYRVAEAVAALFTDLSRDRTELLVRAAEWMPVCHMTLHMIKAYGRIWQNPALADWCDAHLEKARLFSENGPLYRQSYIERVESMRQHAMEAAAAPAQAINSDNVVRSSATSQH